MTKYLIQRIIKSLISVIIVVGVVMVMIYSFLNKQSIFATDPVFTKQKSNAKQVYMMQQWELFGYLDYVSFAESVLRNREGAGALYATPKAGNGTALFPKRSRFTKIRRGTVRAATKRRLWMERGCVKRVMKTSYRRCTKHALFRLRRTRRIRGANIGKKMEGKNERN